MACDSPEGLLENPEARSQLVLLIMDPTAALSCFSCYTALKNDANFVADIKHEHVLSFIMTTIKMLSISWLSLCMMIVCLADANDGAGTREFGESGLRRMFVWNRRLSSNESEKSAVLGDGDNDHADTPATVAVGDNQNHDNSMGHNNHLDATTKSPLPPPPLSRQPKEPKLKQQQTSIIPHINNEIANRLQLMHRAVRRTAAGAISTFSFVASVSMGLTTSAKSRFREIRPAIDTIQIYLEESGISKELAKSFTNRLFQNVVVLWRIQKAYRETHDLRDLVAMKRNQDEIPSMEEASR